MKKRLTVCAAFERQVARSPQALCLSFGPSNRPELYSYQDVHGGAQSVASWMLKWPVSRDECVSLLISNRPEFMVTWLGAHYSGACTSLINTNLRAHALQHSVSSVSSSKLIAGEEYRSVVEEAVSQGYLQGVSIRYVGRYMAARADSSSLWPSAPSSSSSTCDAAILASGVSEAAAELKLRRAGISCRSTLYYIFTSGTTGLPKAAAITNSRFLAAGFGFSALSSLRASDKVYCCLPIYHSSGGMLGFSMVWAVGASMHLSPRFSASKFWVECREHKCSTVQYVGELLRYLTAQLPSPDDRLHGIRMAIGNGLRPNVWAEFNARFGVPRICEFYGSTEGNITLVNTMMRFGWWNSWLKLSETFAPCVQTSPHSRHLTL
jgi:acyl-CoA synthetase (AMP-forming)/AMP-acid ligase II